MPGSSLAPGKWNAPIGQIQVTGPALSLEEGAGSAQGQGVYSQLLQGVSKRLLMACFCAPHKLRTGFFFLRFKGLNKNKKSMLQRLCGL